MVAEQAALGCLVVAEQALDGSGFVAEQAALGCLVVAEQAVDGAPLAERLRAYALTNKPCLERSPRAQGERYARINGKSSRYLRFANQLAKVPKRQHIFRQSAHNPRLYWH